MSVKIMSLIWERAPYTAGSLLVLLALADWANDEGVSWPSMDRLAKKARVDRRSAQRIVRQLARDGVIVIDEGGGRGKQHRYLIQVETVANCRPLAEAETVTPASPINKQKGDISDTETATFEAQRATFHAETVTPVSPDPLVEPLDKDPSVEPSNGYPFHGQAFLTALAEYEQHRKEIRKPLRDTGRKALFAELESYGEYGATRSLIASVANGWTGVFPPRGGNRGAEGIDAVREVLNELEH